MNTTMLEILELADGDVVLRPAGGAGEALVTIRFSAESRAWIGEQRLVVAKAMIEAGIRTTARLAGNEAELDFVNPRELADRSIH
jgi:enoyl-[acyl-carrier-protein] reductase (NADH)